jgi:hypothetical protein
MLKNANQAQNVQQNTQQPVKGAKKELPVNIFEPQYDGNIMNDLNDDLNGEGDFEDEE